MATVIITNTIKDPSGTGIPDVEIKARLRPVPGFRTADSSEVSPEEITTTDGNGAWSLTLEKNADITPTGTYWEIEEKLETGSVVWNVVASANTTLRASLVDPLPTLLGGTYLTQETGDARYVSIGGVTDELYLHKAGAETITGSKDFGGAGGRLRIPRFTKAGLPAPGNAGSLAEVIDAERGMWMDQGSQWFSLSGNVVNVKEFGAKGDDSANDTSAFQAALTAAAGGTLLIPEGIYLVDTTLTYAANTLGPIRIVGTGAGSVIKLTGATNKAFHITGVAGTTSEFAQLQDFRILSATSGTSAAGIHLDGLAIVAVHDVYISGASKMTNGIQCTGAQQGEISGGFVHQCTTGIRLEASGGVHTNGLDIHGVSLNNTATNLVADQADSLFFHSNHLAIAPIGVDVVAGGFGRNSFFHNHIESHTTAGIRAAGGTMDIAGNSFFTGSGGTDINITGGAYGVISGNLFQGSVSLGASVSNYHFINNINTGTGTFTNNSTFLTKFGNRVASSGASLLGAELFDGLTLTSRSSSAGEILKLNANAAVGGKWGMRIAGAGSDDVYLQLNDVVIAGHGGGGQIKFFSGLGGTEWAKFWSGVYEIGERADPGAAPTNKARIYARDNGAGKTQLCVQFQSGAVQVIATEP